MKPKVGGVVKPKVGVKPGIVSVVFTSPLVVSKVLYNRFIPSSGSLGGGVPGGRLGSYFSLLPARGVRRGFGYNPDLFNAVFGRRATSAEKRKLLAIRSFSGFESRKVVL